MLRAVDLLSRARRHLGLSVIHGSGWRSLTAGTWRLQSDLPDRPQHRSGVSLLPEPKQTHGAVVEQWVEKDEKLAFSHAYTGSMFTRARQFRNCCRVLTASSPARALWIDPEWSHWFRPTPAKMAPFFTGVDRSGHLLHRRDVNVTYRPSKSRCANNLVTCSAVGWGFFRRRSAIFCEGDQQFCDSDQESERSDAGFGIVSEVIGMVKEKVEEFDLEQGMRGGRRGQRLRPLFPHPPWRRLLVSDSPWEAGPRFLRMDSPRISMG